MADFNVVGFMSDELSQWRENARKAFPGAFAIADRMNNMGMRMLWDLPTENLTEPQAWAVAGYARSIESFQTCILLAERGALAEARALARLCAEAVIVTAGLLKVEGTLAKMYEDDAKHRLGICNCVLEMNAGSKDAKQLARFEQEKAEIEAEFGKPNPLKLGSLAVQSDNQLLYELSYRLTSGNGAHATLGSFRRHIKAGKDGHLDQYFFSPDVSDMRSTLLSANAAMIHLIGLAVDIMGLKSYEPESRDLILHWQVIREEMEAAD